MLRTKLIQRIALKNADALLHDVLKAVDTSGDGQIQYNGAHINAPYFTGYHGLIQLHRVQGLR